MLVVDAIDDLDFQCYILVKYVCPLSLFLAIDISFYLDRFVI